jgi:hypothetical protein
MWRVGGRAHVYINCNGFTKIAKNIIYLLAKEIKSSFKDPTCNCSVIRAMILHQCYVKNDSHFQTPNSIFKTKNVLQFRYLYL